MKCVELVSVMKRVMFALLPVWFFFSGLVVAQEYEEASTLSFVVLKDDNGKPIRNAAVVLHPDAVPEQRAPAERRRRVDGQHRDPGSPGAERAHERAGDRGFSRSRRAGEADHAGAGRRRRTPKFLTAPEHGKPRF